MAPRVVFRSGDDETGGILSVRPGTGVRPLSTTYVDVAVGAGDPDWLTAQMTALAGPGSPGLSTLDAGAGAGSLAAGTYGATVTVKSNLYQSGGLGHSPRDRRTALPRLVRNA